MFYRMLINFDPNQTPGAGASDDTAKQLADLKAKYDEALKIIEKSKEKPTDDPMLQEKIKKQKELDDAKKHDEKNLEDALKFTLSSESYLKEHKDVLTKDVEDIFKAAEKEKYNSAIEKSNAIKSSIVQSFFSLQANLDMLTPTQKESVQDYLKLTKLAKEEKANDIFKNVFEPCVAMIKRVLKAEQTAKANAGLATGSDSDEAYTKRMIENSQKYYLRKEN